MSQQVVIAGALFNDVPAISVPDSNNVYHDFLDTTIATNAASASDITQGKLAYVNGSLVTGTNQGGGGGTLKVGAIRPDAVLEQSWTYDKYIVADEHATIPAYTTSEQTLKASSALVTNKSLDCTQYDYLITQRGTAIPSYSSSTKGSGRCVYSIATKSLEVVCIPSSFFTVDGKSSDRYASPASTSIGYYGAVLYWRSGSEIRATAGTTYGVYTTLVDPSYTASNAGTPTITIYSPNLRIKGSTSQLNSTYWSYLTDIRYQYIIELWKVPRTGDIDGWIHTSQLVHAINCTQSASGDLT